MSTTFIAFTGIVALSATARVTTELLGKARIPNLPCENPDGSLLAVDTDYFGQKRSAAKPASGAFENIGSAKLKREVW